MKQAISVFLTVCLLSAFLTSCGSTARKQIHPLFFDPAPVSTYI